MDFNAIAIVVVNLMAIAFFTSFLFSKSAIAYKQRAQLDTYLTKLEGMLAELEVIQTNTEAKIDKKLEEKFADSFSALKSIREIDRDVKEVGERVSEHHDKLRLLERELISARVLPLK